VKTLSGGETFDAGVLPAPERTAAGYRVYTADDEERLRFIKAAQRLGLKLGEIREILAFRDREQRPCSYVAGLIDAHLAEVDQQMRDLRAVKRELTVLQTRMRAEGTDHVAGTARRLYGAGRCGRSPRPPPSRAFVAGRGLDEVTEPALAGRRGRHRKDVAQPRGLPSSGLEGYAELRHREDQSTETHRAAQPQRERDDVQRVETASSAR
jgi:DNA-binding transcriptional MerR regulator